MKNLLQFIWKNHFSFLFLLLQTLSLILLFQYNKFQKSAFLNYTAQISGTTYSLLNNFTAYLNLREENKRLLHENAQLRKQIPAYSYYSLNPNYKYFNDTLYAKKYTYLETEIVNSSVNKANNYITINKGRKHGVKPEMGVISHLGVLGVIKDVSENYSVALSILHSKTAVSARLKKNQYQGMITWNSKNAEYVQLNDIPNHVNIIEGDTVVTRSSSAIFPANHPIGTISKIQKVEGEYFYKLDVKLFEDFRKINHGYVVFNFEAIEQKQLENFSLNGQ